MTTQTRPTPAKHYTMADLQPIIDGKLPVPNMVEMDLGTAIGRITLGGWIEGGLGRARINPKERGIIYFSPLTGPGELNTLAVITRELPA